VFADRFLGEPDPDAGDPEHYGFGKRAEHFIFHDEIPGGDPVIVPLSKMSRRKRPAKWFLDREIEYDASNDDHHIFAKSGKNYQAFLDANKGKNVMTSKQYFETIRPLERIRSNVRDHDKAKSLLYGPSLRHIAIVFTCPFSGVMLRCQLDVISAQKIIVDFKTASRNDLWHFAADFYKWKYHFQAAWYREAVRQINGGDNFPVVYIVTEKQSKSYVCEVFHVSDEWFDVALDEWKTHLVHFRHCVETQQWKRVTHNQIVELVPPVFVTRQHRRNSQFQETNQ
jgi:hypothetical protein